MLQKEVSLRLTAQIKTKDYGILSVLLATCASVKELMNVGPGNFHPKPKVDSSVVKIIFHPQSEKISTLPDFDFVLLKNIVKSGFQKRRKTLLNSLSSSALLPFDKNTIKEILNKSPFSPSSRAEELSAEDFIALSILFAEKI